ncbi:hypothetical protein ACFU44_11695 [Nocardia rhizosphaerihabitans]|uniref:ApeA N-terminal domain 1-containing protein n=1 Tax=Nocardia rhizosphaerihabitans TaxID=1691570 RepID=UPI00366FDD7E
MAEKFGDLEERLGWAFLGDGQTRVGAARLSVTRRTIFLELPLDDEVSKALGIDEFAASVGELEPLSERFVFVDHHGRVGLGGCGYSKSTSHIGGDKTGWIQIRAQYAVELGSRVQDYWSVSGMRSEIAGLAAWSGLASVKTSNELNEDGLIQGMSISATSQDPTGIGTDDGLSLKPYFSLSESRSNGQYTISERVFVQTWYDDPIPWEQHLKSHQIMQDLLTFSYWKACGQRIGSVSSSRYPLEKPSSGNAVGEKWRDVVVDWSGRGSDATPMVLPGSRMALFTLQDLGVSGVKRWIDERATWVRVVGPLVASRFQKNHTVEVTILQVGISIEALGYQIALRKGLIQAGGKQSFPQYLKRIEETIDCDLSPVFEGHSGVEEFSNFNDWADAFNGVYKEAKHADHPLPDPIRGWVLSEAGALLVRLWMGRELGVDRSTLERNARYQ